MPALISQLELDRCPYCNVDKPSLHQIFTTISNSHDGAHKRFWKIYLCARCGGLVLASSQDESGWVYEMYPSAIQIDDVIPEPAKSYLQQALDSLHAPAGAVMLAASAIDAMLKNKSYRDGSLKSRIDKAAADHLITEGMAKWAHNIRLDANDQRHADEAAPLPDEADARRSIDFAIALGEFLFVLPAKVNKGLEESKEPTAEEPKKE
jgi:hypothetical protein